MNKNYIVIGLGYGDESKGATVDALCRTERAELVVRFNGGAQAAHNVIDAHTGTHHTFAQWGSGTFAGANTLLSKHMLVNPSRFMVEAEVLKAKGLNISNRVWVSTEAFITTPFHVWLNRVRESARGAARHGTTGMGISETVIDTLARPAQAMRCIDILRGRDWMVHKLSLTKAALARELHNVGGGLEFERLDIFRIAECYEEFGKLVKIVSEEVVGELIRKAGTVVFEGAQGVLLDENYGFHPHTTWSTTTPKNAFSILYSALKTDTISFDNVRIIGVTRTYSTRHGAGPFPTENATVNFAEPHNGDDGMAGQFRKGYLDVPLLRYAIKCCNGMHGLMVSHADCKPVRYCARNPAFDNALPSGDMRTQEGMTRLAWQPVSFGNLEVVSNADVFPQFIAGLVGVQLFGVSAGPSAKDRTIYDDALIK